METGSAITWKYPSCILRGDNSRGEFYSIAVSNGYQQVDSGTKMIHLGKNSSSRIISKGIAAGHSQNTYRGLVSAHRKATNARNFTNCDSLLIGDKCGAHTVPYIEAKNASAHFEHEATTSRISDDKLFYCAAGLGGRGGGADRHGFGGRAASPPMVHGREQKLIGVSLRDGRKMLSRSNQFPWPVTRRFWSLACLVLRARDLVAGFAFRRVVLVRCSSPPSFCIPVQNFSCFGGLAGSDAA